VYRHLVTVEVCVERGTYQRVELDSSAVNEDGLKRLDGKTVKCRRTVKENGVFLDNVFKCVPYTRIVVYLVDLLLSILYVGSLSLLNASLL